MTTPSPTPTSSGSPRPSFRSLPPGSPDPKDTGIDPARSTWELTDAALSLIRCHLPAGSTVLELGSGRGTRRLLQAGFEVISIEHDPRWVGRYHDRYIYAPIIGGWYDPEAIARGLRRFRKPDALIIDGPPGRIGRLGILDHLDLFEPRLRFPIFVDDIDRSAERELLVRLTGLLRRPSIIGEGRKPGRRGRTKMHALIPPTST